MKIVLDLTKLVAEGKLTEAQAQELQALARPQTSLLAISIMMTFGVVAIAAGIMTLIPTPTTMFIIGAMLIALGLGVSFRAGPQWWLLGTALTIVGALVTAGPLLDLTKGQWFGFAGTAVLFLALAIAIRSSFLSALTVLAVAGLFGSGTEYDFASYFLIVQEPTITIVVFAALALGAYFVSLRLPSGYEPLAVTFSRVSLLMINFGFWIGSLWGDDPGHSWRANDALHPVIPDYAFVIGWAVALVGVGIWAARVNRRFVVNTVATFGAIHFYTQWFERLGANPFSILLAGMVVVAIAVGLWRYNVRPRPAAVAA